MTGAHGRFTWETRAREGGNEHLLFRRAIVDQKLDPLAMTESGFLNVDGRETRGGEGGEAYRVLLPGLALHNEQALVRDARQQRLLRHLKRGRHTSGERTRNDRHPFRI